MEVENYYNYSIHCINYDFPWPTLGAILVKNDWLIAYEKSKKFST